MLGLVVTDHLYRTYPDLPEGELTKVRASVVNAAALAEVADELGSGDAVLLGKGEDASGGREKPSILADALEAVIGAVYLDGGWDAAADAGVRPARRPHRRGRRPGPAARTTRPGSRSSRPASLDERARLRRRATRAPTTPSGSSPSVRVAERVFHGGEGRSKKQAEQAAARVAWEALPRCLSCPRSRRSAATSSRRSSASKIKTVEVHGLRSIRRYTNKKDFISRLEDRKIDGRRPPGQVPRDLAGRRLPRRAPAG